MTQEEAKKRAELYTALVEGKTIQCINTKGTWEDLKIEEFFRIYDSNNYRIKPESKYRPFKDQEECWIEMQKHQPFGWIRDNNTQRLCNIGSIGHNNYGIYINNTILYFDVAFNTCNFADGTPFGVKED